MWGQNMVSVMVMKLIMIMDNTKYKLDNKSKLNYNKRSKETLYNSYSIAKSLNTFTYISSINIKR